MKSYWDCAIVKLHRAILLFSTTLLNHENAPLNFIGLHISLTITTHLGRNIKAVFIVLPTLPVFRENYRHCLNSNN
jgi:hypothetical protein